MALDKGSQKVIVTIVLAMFLAVISLITALPPMRNFEIDSSQTIDSSATALMAFSTIIGFFLVPAFAFTLGNSGTANANLSNFMGLVTFAVITVTWILFSFSLVWGRDTANAKGGILSLPMTYYMFNNVGPNLAPDGPIPTSIFAIFELVFAVLPATLVGTHLHGRIEILSWIAFVFAWHLCVWCPIAHVFWHPEGQLARNHVWDYAGGLVVHATAGITAYAADWALGKKEESKNTANQNVVSLTTVFVLISALALFVGKDHGNEDLILSVQTVATTVASVASSVITWILFDYLNDAPTGVIGMSTAVLLGVVGISSSAIYCHVGGALIIGFGTAAVVYLVSSFNKNSAFSVPYINGLGGIVGFFLSSLFNTHFVHPGINDGLVFGQGKLMAQYIATLLVFVPATFIASYLVVFLSNLVLPFSTDGSYAPAASAETKDSVDTPSVEVTNV